MPVGDWVEVRPLGEILATLDARGELDGLPFMPEMVRYCGRRLRVGAVMTKICGGGVGMRGVLRQPLVLLGEERCDGGSHGGCSRECTLLWKPEWLRPSGAGANAPTLEHDVARTSWPYRTQAEDGTYVCQATALGRATFPISTAEKVKRAFDDVKGGEWGFGAMAGVYAETLSHRVRLMLRRLAGAIRASRKTPVEQLALQPGEWVRVKSLKEILETLDHNSKNRGLEFSRYMVPFCSGTYRVKARMENFIDERTGGLRKLENTVLLDGVACGGETTSGPCRRAEYLYWREIWLRRADGPRDAGASAERRP